jgi:hypothetical protein
VWTSPLPCHTPPVPLGSCLRPAWSARSVLDPVDGTLFGSQAAAERRHEKAQWHECKREAEAASTPTTIASTQPAVACLGNRLRSRQIHTCTKQHAHEPTHKGQNKCAVQMQRADVLCRCAVADVESNWWVEHSYSLFSHAWIVHMTGRSPAASCHIVGSRSAAAWVSNACSVHYMVLLLDEN